MTRKVCVLALAALVAWGLKRHYADAPADHLWWILWPTATLSGVLTGTSFVRVPAEGFVSHERLFVIEKACAGVNFMIAAFALTVLGLLHRVRSTASGAVLLGGSIVIAYLSAVSVNAVRITLAMWLAARPVTTAFSGSQAHRIEGIAVYFGALVLLYELVERCDRRTAAVGSTRR
jgi:exosortase K